MATVQIIRQPTDIEKIEDKTRTLFVLGLSGGLDSSVTSLLPIAAGFDTYLITFNYGQFNEPETIAVHLAVQNLLSYKKRDKQVVRHRIVDLVLENKQWFKGILGVASSFLDEEINTDNYKQSLSDILDTPYYYPFRNLLFITVLSSIAESILLLSKGHYTQAYIGLGIHRHVTYNEYWDITPGFAEAVQDILQVRRNVLRQYSKGQFEIGLYVPFIGLLKADIVRLAFKYHFPIEATLTCYNPTIFRDRNEKLIHIISCGSCQACLERASLIRQVLNDQTYIDPNLLCPRIIIPEDTLMSNS